MTITKLSPEDLLYLLTEALKENEALEARLRKTEEARRKLSREKTALETKVTNLRRAGLQLWATMHLAAPTKKETAQQTLDTHAQAMTIQNNGTTVFVAGSVMGGNFNGRYDDSITPHQEKIPPGIDAFKAWCCAADRQQH
ncbi:MAG: hypothetical protein QG581_400 [Patescibacteria group bacterium]|jgi:predicted ribosome quality control (RQC) complex YloA/Tae2 family protein|nr:hypothetical protein [Patescibacteria group bacterium]